MKKGNKGKKSYKIDFGEVPKERRKRGKRIPEGDYLFKIVKADRRKKEGGSSYYFSWTFQLIEDSRGGTKYAGLPFYYITSLKPEALFNLRNLILAASDGKTNVAGKVMNFDPAKLYGKKIGGTVEDDEYDGKMRSHVVDIFPPSELEAAEEEEDEDEDEEEEDEDEDEEDDDDDEDEDDDEEEEEEDELDDVDLEEEL
jgi:hypothetical protein